MPQLPTIHEKLFKENIKTKEDIHSSELNQLINKITFDLLRDSPSLVANVANKITEQSVLDKAIIKMIDKQNYHLLGLDRDEVIKKVNDFIFGYGPLQEYVEDEDISDIDITKYDEVCIKRKGIKQEIALNFGSEQILETYCKLLAVRNNGILDENNSQCRVTDEKLRLRINIAIRPRNESGPSISIRKHRLVSYTLENLCRENMFDEHFLEISKKIASLPLNIIICGKGGTGKTTYLRALINNMPVMDRILIAESNTELYPDKKYCISQRIKRENEGGLPVTLRDIIKDGLTMSLDTYIIGEVVSGEAIEFIKAIHSGHRGLISTHALDARAALYRMVTLSKSANVGESEDTIKEMLGTSLDIVIFMKDFKVNEVIEVKGYDANKDEFLTDTIFKYNNGCLIKLKDFSFDLE